jgi:hypothetical protein
MVQISTVGVRVDAFEEQPREERNVQFQDSVTMDVFIVYDLPFALFFLPFPLLLLLFRT